MNSETIPSRKEDFTVKTLILQIASNNKDSIYAYCNDWWDCWNSGDATVGHPSHNTWVVGKINKIRHKFNTNYQELTTLVNRLLTLN